MQWLSRTLAIVMLMVSPGVLGTFLDRKCGTKLFTPIGFLLGMALATFILILLARKLTPVARGEPIPFDDEDADDLSDD